MLSYKFVSVQYFFLLLLSIILYLFIGDSFNIKTIYIVLTFLCVSLLLFIFRKEEYVGLKYSYIRPTILFLLGYIIVHFQRLFDLAFEIVDVNNIMIFPNITAINKSSYLSVIGLVSFLLGYVMNNKRNRNNKQALSYSYKDKTIYLSFINLCLIIVFFKTVGMHYINGGYGSGIKIVGTSAGYVALIIELLFYSIMILKAYADKCKQKVNRNIFSYIKQYDYLFYIDLFLYGGMVILSGDRGPVIYIMLSYFICGRIFLKRKIPLKYLLICIVSFGMIITLLGKARTYRDQDFSFGEKIELAINNIDENEESVIPFTSELAASIRSLNYLVAYMPEYHDFMYGENMFKRVITVIPFASNINNVLFNDSKKYDGSAEFITWIEQGERTYYGVGTTCVADFYFDFGLLGVLVFMFVFGMIFKVIDIYVVDLNTNSLFFLTLSIYTFSLSIYFPRSSFWLAIRNFIWLYVIIRFYIYLFRNRESLVSR